MIRRRSRFARAMAASARIGSRSAPVRRHDPRRGDAHRLERPISDVQRDLDALDTSIVELRQQLRSEVQPRGRRGDRSADAREDRLVTLAVGERIAALDVRRERHVAERLDHRVNVTTALDPQTNRSTAVKVAGHHLPKKHTGLSLEAHQGTRLQLLSRMHQRVGDSRAVRGLLLPLVW